MPAACAVDLTLKTAGCGAPHPAPGAGPFIATKLDAPIQSFYPDRIMDLAA